MEPTKSHKVLVVDDEGLIANDIASHLEALGHEVVGTAGTAEEAIEKASGADIVLMDIRLDGAVDGIDAATAIRQRYHIPVVFLTAYADKATIERAKAAEPFGYIVKPLTHATLNTSVEMAVYKHRMERNLREREAWLATTLGSVADAVIVTDPEGRISMLNRTAEILTGWVQAEAHSQPISKVIRLAIGDREGDAGDPVALAILRDAPVMLDASATLISRSGRELQVEGSAAPVKTDGPAIGAVLTIRDVSARRWEERQLRQVQKLEAAGRLAASVSSDYANLLTIVRHRAEQLMEQFGEYSPARRQVEEIREAAITAERLNRRLALFGTRQVSQTEVIGLNATLRRIFGLIQSVAGSAIEVNMRLDPATARIKADTTQIEQAIMSVIMHACASMPGGGRVLIETGNAEIPVHGRLTPHALLAITHTGVEPDPEKLFEPASSGEEAMALSIVHAIVTEHGGYISAQVTAGGGCRFEILLPQSRGVVLIPKPVGGEAPSILLVEHRDLVRAQIHNFFEANGYNLLEAADAAEATAIGQVHEGSLDLLIAEAQRADALSPDLRASHPAMAVLRVVGGPPKAPDELRTPFTQKELLDRVEELMNIRLKLESATAG